MLTFSKCLIPLVLVAIVCSASSAQVDPPMDPTVWQKLGVRNSIRRFQKRRDALVNRKGNRPQLEKTPELLKLADPKLLELPKFVNAEMMKVAAEAKIDADLAPQKIKAVKYLAGLGCGCNSNIAPALLAALKDCHPDVRTAAVQAVMTTAQRVDSCQGKKRLSLGKGKLGKAGAGRGGCGCGDVCNSGCGCCGVATSCNVCGACCSKDIQDKLKEMASGQYDNGCDKEPVASIRQLAQQTLDMCPPPGEFDDQTKDKPKAGVEGENKNGDETPKKDGEGTPKKDGDDTSTSYQFYDNIYPQKSQSISISSNAREIPLMNRENMVKGLLAESASPFNATIKFGESLKIPTGSKLTLMTEQGSTQQVKVIGSSVGRVQIQTLDQEHIRFDDKTKIWVGILAN